MNSNTTMEMNSTITNMTNSSGTPNTSSLATDSEGSWIDPKAIEMIGYVTVPLFFVIGLTGNLFSMAVMQTSAFRRSTICIYLTALSISDTTFILIGPFTKSFMKDIFSRDPKALTVAGCKAYFCIFRSAKICSSWFVVTICIERFIVVWFPLKAKLISTRRTALVAVTCVAVSVLTFDGVWTMTTDIVNGACVPSVITEATKDISAAFVIAGTAIFNIIPTCILLLFTPLTVAILFRQQSVRRGMSTSAGSVDTLRITRMLVSIMCAYIVLVTPISIAHSVAFFNGDSIFESTNPRFIVFREFAQILEQLNYCVNFFLYAAFNITFRRSFYGLFAYCRRRDSSRNAKVKDAKGSEGLSARSGSSTSSTNLDVSQKVVG